MPDFSMGYLDNLTIRYVSGGLTQCGDWWGETNTAANSSKIYYVTGGACTIELDGTAYHGAKGAMFLVPAGVQHSYSHCVGSYVKKYWFHFNMETGGRPFFDLFRVPVMVQTGDIPKLRGWFRETVKYGGQQTAFETLRLKAAILNIVAFYLEKGGAVYTSVENDGLTDILSYINSNLDRRVSVEELARLAHLHPNYFIRYFKAQMGTSPAKYVQKLRMERAKTLLATTNLSAAAVMKEVGFEDASHFSKCFKNYTGYSPSLMREMSGKSVL